MPHRGGDKHFSHTGEGGGQTILTFGVGGHTFLTHRGGTNIFATQGGEKFYVEDVGGDDDVDGEEEDVSEANILVSEGIFVEFLGARRGCGGGTNIFTLRGWTNILTLRGGGF